MKRLINHTISQFYDKEQKNFIYLARDTKIITRQLGKFLWIIKFLGAGIKSFRDLCHLEDYSKDIIKDQLRQSKDLISLTDGEALVIRERILLKEIFF